MFGVFSSVWSPDELAGMASVLCAEVCVKCFVCRALCNNEHNSAFALLHCLDPDYFALPHTVLCAKTAEVCQECIVPCVLC